VVAIVVLVDRVAVRPDRFHLQDTRGAVGCEDALGVVNAGVKHTEKQCAARSDISRPTGFASDGNTSSIGNEDSEDENLHFSIA